MKNGKAAGPSGVMPEMMVKAAGEAGVDMITDLVNQIIVEGAITGECELSTVVNCYKGSTNSLERGNYRELKLIDQILNIADIIIEKLIRQQVDIDEMRFDFMPGCGTKNAIFILRQIQQIYLAKKKKKKRICTLHL